METALTTKSDLEEVFRSALQLPPEISVPELKYNSIQQWDSVGHMTLVAAIETKFGIMLDTDDVLNMESFAVAVDILKKYDVAIEA